MSSTNLKCRHPGRVRRVIAVFAVLGEGFAAALNQLGLLLQKVAGTLRFEHFWARHVSNDPRVIIVPSFDRSRTKHPIWDIAVQQVLGLGEGGKLLEFGTNNGGSLLYFWRKLPGTLELHGFDCFEGIPEDWDALPKGSIKGYGYPFELWTDHPDERPAVAAAVARTGAIPPVPQPNITIHKGLFAHTLPVLLKDGVPQDIRLIHFDADIYMGTRPVMDTLCGQMGYRYYVLFDELYSVNHEFRAWMEFVALFNVQAWRVIAISEDGVQALFEVN
jgi:hypothetical protein